MPHPYFHPFFLIYILLIIIQCESSTLGTEWSRNNQLDRIRYSVKEDLQKNANEVNGINKNQDRQGTIEILKNIVNVITSGNYTNSSINSKNINQGTTNIKITNSAQSKNKQSLAANQAVNNLNKSQIQTNSSRFVDRNLMTPPSNQILVRNSILSSNSQSTPITAQTKYSTGSSPTSSTPTTLSTPTLTRSFGQTSNPQLGSPPTMSLQPGSPPNGYGAPMMNPPIVYGPPIALPINIPYPYSTSNPNGAAPIQYPSFYVSYMSSPAAYQSGYDDMMLKQYFRQSSPVIYNQIIMNQPIPNTFINPTSFTSQYGPQTQYGSQPLYAPQYGPPYPPPSQYPLQYGTQNAPPQYPSPYYPQYPQYSQYPQYPQYSSQYGQQYHPMQYPVQPRPQQAFPQNGPQFSPQSDLQPSSRPIPSPLPTSSTFSQNNKSLSTSNNQQAKQVQPLSTTTRPTATPTATAAATPATATAPSSSPTGPQKSSLKLIDGNASVNKQTGQNKIKYNEQSFSDTQSINIDYGSLINNPNTNDVISNAVRDKFGPFLDRYNSSLSLSLGRNGSEVVDQNKSNSSNVDKNRSNQSTVVSVNDVVNISISTRNNSSSNSISTNSSSQMITTSNGTINRSANTNPNTNPNTTINNSESQTGSATERSRNPTNSPNSTRSSTSIETTTNNITNVSTTTISTNISTNSIPIGSTSNTTSFSDFLLDTINPIMDTSQIIANNNATVLIANINISVTPNQLIDQNPISNNTPTTPTTPPSNQSIPLPPLQETPSKISPQQSKPNSTTIQSQVINLPSQISIPGLTPLPQINSVYQDYIIEFKQMFIQSSVTSTGRQDEGKYRELIFKQNLKLINKFNANPNRTYNMGLNTFTDVDSAEFQKMYFGIREEGQVGQFKGKFPTIVVDWTCFASEIVNSRFYQGCNKGAAISATEVLYITRKIFNLPALPYSFQQLIFCNPNQSCNSSKTPQQITQFSYIQQQGVGYSKQFATNSPFNLKLKQKCPQYLSAGKKNYLSSKAFFQSYKQIKAGDCEEVINRLRYGPLSVGIAGDGLQFYAGGVYTSDRTGVDVVVTLVGYQSGRFLVQNSWSDRWGMKGYAIVGEKSGVCNNAVYATIKETTTKPPPTCYSQN